jgi:tRNA-dihydrouridine synthase A
MISKPSLELAVFVAGVCCYQLAMSLRAGCFVLVPPGRRHQRVVTAEAVVRSRMFSTSPNCYNSTDVPPSARARQDKYDELRAASKLQLAPMMEYTDRHFRHLVRLVSGRTLLYTEMVAANALSHERRAMMEECRTSHPQASPRELRETYSDRYLRRYLAQGRVLPLEGASVLQLGGSDPQQMFEAAETVVDMTERGWCDYTALNLNCGCPSPKVAGKGCFGAALMESPKLVNVLTKALHDGTGGRLPVSVKCRIGTDSREAFTQASYAELDAELEYSRLCNFVEEVAANGVVTDFSVHARIAVLQKSFSPSENRKIPPLKYDIVRRLVNDYPEFTFTLNGGVDSLSQAERELEACPGLSGVMIGRAWAADPWSFAMADQLLYCEETSLMRNRLEVLTEYGRHADLEEHQNDPVKIRRFIVKAVTTLFTSEPNAKQYRIALDEIAGIPKKLHSEGKSLGGLPPLSEMLLEAAHAHLSEEVLLRTPEESHERKVFEERKVAGKSIALRRSSAIAEWQSNRDKNDDAASKITFAFGPICTLSEP